MKQNHFLLIILFLFDISFSLSQTSFSRVFKHFCIYDTDGIKLQGYQRCCAAIITFTMYNSFAVFHVNDPTNIDGNMDYKILLFEDSIIYQVFFNHIQHIQQGGGLCLT